MAMATGPIETTKLIDPGKDTVPIDMISETRIPAIASVGVTSIPASAAI